MLEIKVEETEIAIDIDDKTKLIRVPSRTLRLEHSLSSLSKWEENWEIPFYSKDKKNAKQLLSYVKMMSIEPIDDHTLAVLGKKQFDQINDYLNSKRSATWFSDENKKVTNGPVVTSELIYYWMSAFGIPFECDKWPIQRLMNLIKIHQIKAEQASGKKSRTNRSEMLSERQALNMKRRQEMNSKG